MPRTRHSAAPVSTSIELVKPPRLVRLRSTPKERGGDYPIIPPANQLKGVMTYIDPRRAIERTRYGRSLSLDRIDTALRNADYGSMMQLTDLSRETIDTDPHLAAVLGKRFGALSALPWDIVAVDGYGIDQAKARFYAELVRDQIKQLPDFGQRLHQLAWGLFDGRAVLENDWMLLPEVPGMPTIVHPQFGAVRWQLRDMEWVHPRRLQFGPKREVRISDHIFGYFSLAGLGVDDFPCKFVQFKPQMFGDYQEREGLARRCLYWSFFKRVGARERMILLELFGKPWRWLEVDEDSTADGDDLTAADEQLQQIGGMASFRFPRGTKFQIAQPAKGAGEVHNDVIAESDKQISKLVLGQTGTTDANPAGLNNAQANVMQDEQFMILLRDANLMSEAVETYLTDAIIELNFGSAELPYAPHFKLRADVPLDRVKEIGRLKAAIETGLEVSADEAYEISGFRHPKEDDAVLRWDTPPAHPLAVQPPTERAVMAYPAKTALVPRVVQPIAIPGAGGLKSPTLSQADVQAQQFEKEQLAKAEAAASVADSKSGDPNVDGAMVDNSGEVGSANRVHINPSDLAKVVSVNEARASEGLPPLAKMDGSVDPDGFLTVYEFAAKREALAAAGGKVAEAHGTAVVEQQAEKAKQEAVAETLANALKDKGPPKPPGSPPNGAPPTGGPAPVPPPASPPAGQPGAPAAPASAAAASAQTLPEEVLDPRFDPEPLQPAQNPNELMPGNVDFYTDEDAKKRIKQGVAPTREAQPSDYGMPYAPDQTSDKPSPEVPGVYYPFIPQNLPPGLNSKAAGNGYAPAQVTAPFAGFQDFEECVQKIMKQGHDRASASAICGSLQSKTEGHHATACKPLLGPAVVQAMLRAHPKDVREMICVYAHEAGQSQDCQCMHHGFTLARGAYGADLPEEVRAAKQPEGHKEIGSIENIITRGVKYGARVSGAMCQHYVDAVKGVKDGREAHAAIMRASKTQNLHPFARAMERNLLMGAMTGGLDSHVEYTTGKYAKPVAFSKSVQLEGEEYGAAGGGTVEAPQFVAKPFGEAVSWFKAKNVVPRSTFDLMDSAAKRKAFTISDVMNARQRDIAYELLQKQMQEGTQLDTFAEELSSAFDSAGLMPGSPSHIENIYRTNVLGAYNAGRYEQMSQPDVLENNGYWQIRTVNDGPPRQRPTHQAVHGWTLKADDPVWDSLYPPFGWNCRCRVVSISNLEVKEGGYTVHAGSEMSGLPDPGFTSGPGSAL